MKYLRNLYSFFSNGRCVCCAQPTYNKLFVHAFICTNCTQYIKKIPQKIHPEHTIYHSIFVYGIYEGLLQDIIPQYKYDAKLYYAPLLADMLLLTLTAFIKTHYTYCIPVPQHREKARSRGFYHLGILADYISQYTAIPNLKTSLQTIKNYPSQQSLSREKRIYNVENVFTIHTHLEGAHILILDDVITTGATITAVAKNLQNAGVKHIDCLAIAINKRGIC